MATKPAVTSLSHVVLSPAAFQQIGSGQQHMALEALCLSVAPPFPFANPLLILPHATVVLAYSSTAVEQIFLLFYLSLSVRGDFSIFVASSALLTAIKS